MTNEKANIQCPNCGKKGSMWNRVSFLTQEETDFINQFHDPKQQAYCDGEECGYVYLHKYKTIVLQERSDLIRSLEEVISYVPIITLQNPFGWEYEILEMITAQTTTGTGAITEIFAQVADFMGDQSNRHNDKIKIAENLCKFQLRADAAQLGGNAVVGCDVDIATGGSGNGLIIVCMTGTAIRIKNIDILGEKAEKIKEISTLQDKIHELNNLLPM